ncbi:hypothetical protein [Paracoccus jiaweipingae]|uniref:hypothetical protein n=1 Tax=unclassified Paracoccus (in: a-proteobacteria) TaxID=2688777 RepID=UPI0037B3759B
MLRAMMTALALTLGLAACGADNIYASDEAVRKARFVSDQPPSITLFTVIGIPRGEGAHSALMINGSQRVIFDPAGSWSHPAIPERHDVMYGITDNFKNFYVDYHARQTYWVAEDRILVSREVADAAIRAAEANGSVNKSFCANGTADVLRRVPGFEAAPSTFSPRKLRDWFLRQPGVVSKKHYDGDPANNHDVLLRQHGQLVGYLPGYQRPDQVPSQ